MAKGKIVKKGTTTKPGTTIKKGTAKAAVTKKGEIEPKLPKTPLKPTGESHAIWGVVQQCDPHLEVIPAPGYTIEMVLAALQSGEATWEPGQDTICLDVKKKYEVIATVTKEEYDGFQVDWYLP